MRLRLAGRAAVVPMLFSALAMCVAGGNRAFAASPSPDAPSRGSQLYATNFDPSTFNQTPVPDANSASLTQGSGPSLLCTVSGNVNYPTGGDAKMIASAKTVPSEPTSIWAEYDLAPGTMNGAYVASLYFEGVGGNHHHLHIDYSNDTVTLRDPSYHNEGPLVSVPALAGSTPVHFVVVDTSPRFRVYANNALIIDYTSTIATTPGGYGFDCAGQGGGTGSDTITNFSLYTVRGACAAGWTCADIGGPSPQGAASLNGSTWTVQGGGGDVWGSADQFQYAWQTLSSGGSITAHVTALTNTNSWAKAGVMLRSSTDPGSPDYQLFVTPSNGIVVQSRSTQGGSTGTVATLTGKTVPQYLGVGVSGTTFTAYTSSDGVSWSAISGSARSLGFGPSVLAGIAVTSHNNGTLTSATVSNVTVTSGCPSGWSCADIGSPTPAGSQSLSGSTWTIKGGGSDIQGTADHFHLVYRSLAANGAISARVVSQTNPNGWAKAGVMLRASSASGAADYALLVTPSNGITVQWRTTSGGNTSTLEIGGTVPTYLKVQRSGSTYAAYTSSNGSTWTLVPNSTKTISMSGTVLEGLAVTSHNSSALCTVTADTVVAS